MFSSRLLEISLFWLVGYVKTACISCLDKKCRFSSVDKVVPNFSKWPKPNIMETLSLVLPCKTHLFISPTTYAPKILHSVAVDVYSSRSAALTGFSLSSSLRSVTLPPFQPRAARRSVRMG